MKINFQKVFKGSALALACLILAASISFGATPVSAAENYALSDERTEIYRGDLNISMNIGGLRDFPTPELFVYYPVDLCVYASDVPLVFSSYITFTDRLEAATLGSLVAADVFGDNAQVVVSTLVFLPYVDDNSSGGLSFYSFDLDGPFTFGDARVEIVVYAPLSTSAPSEPSPALPSGIYGNVHNLLRQHIYGDAELSSDMTLTLTILATICCLIVVLLPFTVCWVIIRKLFL